jgi:hypothetical protein
MAVVAVAGVVASGGEFMFKGLLRLFAGPASRPFP